VKIVTFGMTTVSQLGSNVTLYSLDAWLIIFLFAGTKKPVVLRASQLESVTASSVSSSTVDNSSSSFALSPAKLNNPFFKAGKIQ
jgi:hypothetical protein